MHAVPTKVVLAASLFVFGVAMTPAHAQTIHADLLGYQEVPALSTGASGDFRAKIDKNPSTLTYELTYADLSAPVQQAHIHVGQPGVNGGIAIFLCTNLGNGPAETPTCPGPTSGAVSCTVDFTDVVGPAGQGIAPGEFTEVLEAIKAGVVYVNVHSDTFTGGEIRG
jgi:hypothetical protein